MLEYLKELDQAVFLYLNGIHNPTFDFIMYWITYKVTWYPFYALLAFWMFWKFKKKAIVPLIILIAGVAISDQITSSFMKPFFERLRPCHDPDIMDLVHVVKGCGGLYGFASSHASNSFVLATLFYLFFRNHARYTGLLFVWAAIVSYSRIYVGVHYPGDVLAGAAVGIITGILLYYLYTLLPPKYALSS